MSELIERPDNIHQQIANLPQDIAILKMENENFQALASAHPRNFEIIKKELVASFDAFPQLAAASRYRKPVGTDPDTGRQKYAIGLSVRAAEALAEAYAYNRVVADLVSDDGQKVKITATFVDFQRGRMWQDSAFIGRTYKRKGGGVGTHPEDRFFDVVVKAAKSKVIREVIVRSVNPGLKVWFEAEIAKRIDALLTPEKMEEIFKAFAGRGLTQSELKKLLGREEAAALTKEDRNILHDLWNALEDGETTIDELKATLAGEGAKRPNGTGTRSDQLADQLEARTAETPAANGTAGVAESAIGKEATSAPAPAATQTPTPEATKAADPTPKAPRKPPATKATPKPEAAKERSEGYQLLIGVIEGIARGEMQLDDYNALLNDNLPYAVEAKQLTQAEADELTSLAKRNWELHANPQPKTGPKQGSLV
jgi:hypothetical protein